MAVIIPDLFGAFQKGREYAIDRNWKDLENYETIEKMRTANDMAQLALLQERYYTPLKMSMFADNADNSAMQNQIQFTAFPGALSNARQFTNQAISNEGVQAATLPSTAQAQVATTLANNNEAVGEATEKNAYAGSVDWGGKGKANAAVTNFKVGKALNNAELDQVVFELQRAVQKGEAGKVLFELGLDKATRPQQEEIARLTKEGKIEELKQYLVNLRNGTPTGAGNNGQAIKFVNPAFQYDTDLTIIEKMNEIDNIIAKQPNLANDVKANYQRIRETYSKELADRGISPRSKNTNESNQPLIPQRPTTTTPGRGVYRLNTDDQWNRLNIGSYYGLTPTQRVANQPQDLAGGGQPQQNQPQQTTYQSPYDADLAAYENKIKTKSKFGAEQKNRILGAINLQRNSSLFNTWGGIVGENDQYRGSVLVNGKPIPYSTNTAVNLTALENNLTPLQRELKQSLLLSGEFPVKSVNGKLEFDLGKLFPRIENNQVLTNPLINRGGNYGSSSTNPIYR